MTEAARKVTHNLQKVDMKVWAAVFVVFSFVCSGGYGIEDMVSESGPGFTLLQGAEAVAVRPVTRCNLNLNLIF